MHTSNVRNLILAVWVGTAKKELSYTSSAPVNTATVANINIANQYKISQAFAASDNSLRAAAATSGQQNEIA